MSTVVDNVLQRYCARVTFTRRTTIRDVAEQAGVSVATVSKVINQRYGVAKSTLARVQGVIDELGYESSIVASSLRSHQTNVLGILVADLEPFSTELLKGAAKAVRGTGYELVVYSAGRRCGRRGRLGAALPRQARRHPDRRRRAGHPDGGRREVGIPVVAVDPHTGDSRVPTVDSDNLRGARLATDHLIGLGHRRIGFIAGRPGPGIRPAAASGLRTGPGRGRHPDRPRPGRGWRLPGGEGP